MRLIEHVTEYLVENRFDDAMDKWPRYDADLEKLERCKELKNPAKYIDWFINQLQLSKQQSDPERSPIISLWDAEDDEYVMNPFAYRDDRCANFLRLTSTEYSELIEVLNATIKKGE